MGIIVNKNQQMDNELTRRIDKDLRAKQVAMAEGEEPDLAEDAAYLQNLKKTSRFGWVWIVLIVLAIGGLFAIVHP